MDTFHVILWCLLAGVIGIFVGAFFAWNNGKSKVKADLIAWIEKEAKTFGGDIATFVTHIKAKL